MFYLCFCINIYIYTGVQRFPCQMMFNSLTVTRRMSLVGQELITLPKHTSSLPVVSGARVTRSLVLCVCFVIRCLSFCPFTFGHCCLSSDLLILITPMISSNCYCQKRYVSGNMAKRKIWTWCKNYMGYWNIICRTEFYNDGKPLYQ